MSRHLPEEEQIALCMEAKRGNVAARNKLVETSLGLVYKAARQTRLPHGCEVDDLVGGGVLSLFRAIELYDPAKGVKFSTYAANWIWCGVGNAAHDARGHRRADTSRAKVARSYREALAEGRSDDEAVAAAAVQHGVQPETVRKIHAALHARRVSLDAPLRENPDSTLLDLLASDEPSAEQELETRSSRRRIMNVVERFRGRLKQRERDIFNERILDDEANLAELGRRHGISRERARQIELALRSKIRDALLASGLEPLPEHRRRVPRWSDLAEREAEHRARMRRRSRALKNGLCAVCWIRPLAPDDRTRCPDCRSLPRASKRGRAPGALSWAPDAS